jgi:hypothetical protein
MQTTTISTDKNGGYKGTPQSRIQSLTNGPLEIFNVFFLEGDFAVESDDGTNRSDLFGGNVR